MKNSTCREYNLLADKRESFLSVFVYSTDFVCVTMFFSSWYRTEKEFSHKWWNFERCWKQCRRWVCNLIPRLPSLLFPGTREGPGNEVRWVCYNLTVISSCTTKENSIYFTTGVVIHRAYKGWHKGGRNSGFSYNNTWRRQEKRKRNTGLIKNFKKTRTHFIFP